MRYAMILAVASGCSRAPLPTDTLTGHWAMHYSSAQGAGGAIYDLRSNGVLVSALTITNDGSATCAGPKSETTFPGRWSATERAITFAWGMNCRVTRCVFMCTPTDGQSTVGYTISTDERALTLNWDEAPQVFTRE